MPTEATTHVLDIQDLHAEVAGKEILKGVTLSLRSGELTALMGPNGSGKSTLAYALMGHPKYKVTQGRALLDGQDLLKLSVDQRSRAVRGALASSSRMRPRVPSSDPPSTALISASLPRPKRR